MDLQQFLPLSLDRINVWIGVLCTLAIYSLLYRENPLYRFFEHMYIGLAAGYSLGPLGVDILYRYWITPIWVQGQWAWAFLVPFGMYLYFIYSERYGWVSRLVIGALVGTSAGLFFQEFASRYVVQLHSTLSRPLWMSSANPEADLFGVITNWVFIIILVSVLVYFTFSYPQKGVVKNVATAGRWFLMIGLGAIFGNTVMARMALLIGRIYYLLSDWLMIRI
ncbi:MAG: hypothetical protein K6U12_02560 [Armatimonadetes bacterium]|nr:hypothetical protein [Armatimonadota bacterium]GIV13156.1 MAG: hypothetical protein KatS3mg021_1438 [Fimbriimonadales bacterium]CUU37814.1 hypothetical protein DCOP10_120252 [Armatimonadetes bacterium DC]